MEKKIIGMIVFPLVLGLMINQLAWAQKETPYPTRQSAI